MKNKFSKKISDAKIEESKRRVISFSSKKHVHPNNRNNKGKMSLLKVAPLDVVDFKLFGEQIREVRNIG